MSNSSAGDIDFSKVKGNIPESKAILDAFIISNAKLKRSDKAVVSVSGGSDSDVVVDMVSQLKRKDVEYVFVNPGLELTATRLHITHLEAKYGINVQRIRPKITIPIACKKYGQPFLNKYVSNMLYRLQRHHFSFTDEPYEVLIKKYPNCKIALDWYCNRHYKGSRFVISRNRLLKEFLVNFPPYFEISAMCCVVSKERPLAEWIQKNKIDLDICGVRKAEGGVRAGAYRNCFTYRDDGASQYRPIFYFKKQDKDLYNQHYDVKNSVAYEEYGLKRTGCAGCPCSLHLEDECFFGKL